MQINLHPLYNKDLLTNVFSFLEPENIGRIQSVCKLWAQFVNNNTILWKPYCNKEKHYILCSLSVEGFPFKKTLYRDTNFIEWKAGIIRQLENFESSSIQVYRDLKTRKEAILIELNDREKKNLTEMHKVVKVASLVGALGAMLTFTPLPF